MSASELLDDTRELLARVARGEEQAFRILYDLYSRKVYAFAFSILKDPVLGEEVMQESMLKIWQMGPKSREIKNLDAYLKMISRNYCFNLLRRQKLEQRVSSKLFQDWEEAHDETQDLLLLKEAKKILQDAVDTLPQYHKKVYELCYQKGMKYEEAAEELQLSPHTVKTYMKHSLRTIRTYLSQNSDLAILLILFKIN